MTIMKKTLFFLSFFILFSNLTFSQIGYQFKPDTTIKALKFNSYRLEKINDWSSNFDAPFKIESLITSNFSKKKYLTILEFNKEKKNNEGEMPCLVPEGYYPMKIMTPDSSKRYSLIIKQL